MKGEAKRSISVKYTDIVKLVTRVAVNFMRIMISLDVKQILEDRINQLEDNIQLKVNQGVDQLKEEIQTVRGGQINALEQKGS